MELIKKEALSSRFIGQKAGGWGWLCGDGDGGLLWLPWPHQPGRVMLLGGATLPGCAGSALCVG